MTKRVEQIIYTIGHAENCWQSFLELLNHYGIDVVVDVRGRPYDPETPEFDVDHLRVELARQGLKYIYMGDVLGEDATVRARLESEHSNTPPEDNFAAIRARAAIERLKVGSQRYRMTLLDRPGKPTDRHAHRILAPLLGAQGFEVMHILPCGGVSKAALLDGSPAHGD